MSNNDSIIMLSAHRNSPSTSRKSKMSHFKAFFKANSGRGRTGEYMYMREYMCMRQKSKDAVKVIPSNLWPFRNYITCIKNAYQE